MNRCFAVQVDDEVFEPEYPVGSYVIMDPDLKPTTDKLVFVRVRFRAGGTVEYLTVYRGPSGHDVNGHFCKRGSPQEMISCAPMRFSREEEARGVVTILGTEVGTRLRLVS